MVGLSPVQPSRERGSGKTADHHIQHIYAKVGVSTRATAALWASQHTLVAPCLCSW
jgi:DNA-binding CsgD family transcriptional regulator